MKRIFLFSMLLLTFSTGFANPPVEEGKTIFAQRCAGCHNVNKVLTGPALAGITDRRSMDWIISFVRSSQSVIKSGDKDAIAVFEKFNKIPMPDHADLTDENIKSIVEYISVEGKSASDKPLFAKPGYIRPAYVPLIWAKDYKFFIGYFILVLMLIGSLLFAVRLKEYETDFSDRK